MKDKSKYGTASYPLEPKSNANCITRERVDELATKIDEELPSGNSYEFECPDGYIFKDENGNVINATKIVLEKKKKEYPKTYCECKDILGLWDIDDTERGYYKTDLIDKLQMLLICRDAYRKIAGEEMGLGKPWEPDWNTSEPKYVIACTSNGIEKQWETTYRKGFAFPTEEMRDAFYENFKELIESVKELL